MRTLTIKLAAPLQSYGNEATFSRRTSYHYPSKSAVLGMIAAALGYRRDDPRILQLNRLIIAVRIDQPGRILTDFQTIQYDQKHNKRSLSYKDYLQDAVFITAISGDDQQIMTIENALHHPKFQLFLGRRVNVPAGPLHTQVFENSDPVSVLKTYPWQAAKWYQRRVHQDYYSAELITDANLVKSHFTSFVKDNIGSFDENHRWHVYRSVASIRVKLLNKSYQNTEHDIMANI
ncbi:type I-E CRISPR-associated protein Cas5/CasD [Limosilactobacillus fastidiosus]|uniref:Type I-E CRISPR-associated protein Cas5/CasD n=2 Tax=Limosilactobacillus fastidiosus TaxID=2759855 RepID=A0ABR6E6P3_9LACO|nr:type I-E CRISPR-associated protein Cas5/CasD [Limosilactobacillus fastidiosus]MBB1062863.1 type I-E CRISPR-associated protein Cas5/CasD [Limosilactobacillus fastidiosus]MCD7084087.1 type I-E CRISPR-associated protein Cas5/CasD [Limosilactobacillus fastidiosus]